jgi:LasA protease
MRGTDRRPTRPARGRRGRKRGHRKHGTWGIRWIALAVTAILLTILFIGCSRRQDPTPTPDASSESASKVAAAPDNPTATTSPSPTVPSRASGLSNAGSLLDPSPATEVYVVQKGDTLSGIAHRFGCDVKALASDNQISDPRLLQVGQEIQISACQLETGPANRLLPNSEFVNSPAYVGFDTAAFCNTQGGYLANYYENVGGEILSGPEIVDRIAYHYSVGPRMLLAILELKSGWVTNPSPSGEALSYPMGYKGGGWELLSLQVAWAADELNKGYYDWRGRGMAPISWRDGTVTRYDPGLNAATAGLHYFFSLKSGKRQWETLVGEGSDSFIATYRRLFGDPAQHAIEPLIPAGTTQPALSLPWPEGELWYFTGGPHGGWEDGSAWAALDFVPDEGPLGCRVASSWAAAAAPGRVIYSQDGEVVIDLDADGHQETGWVLFYLHVADQDRIPVGTRVETGDRIGHASCEGGLAEATHLHIARRYNGEWMAADGPIPLVLSGWQAHTSGKPYEGTLTRGKKVRTACECRDQKYNGLVADR